MQDDYSGLKFNHIFEPLMSRSLGSSKHELVEKLKLWISPSNFTGYHKHEADWDKELAVGTSKRRLLVLCIEEENTIRFFKVHPVVKVWFIILASFLQLKQSL